MNNIVLKNVLFVALMALCSSALSIDRVQTIELKKGWNAVYLNVDPEITGQNISAYIASTIGDASSLPIEIITTYLPMETSVEYIDSPDEKVWKQPSWNTWIRDDLPESFLTNLYDLEAGQAYLIKSSRDFTWNVKGAVRRVRTKWHADSFNFVGFQVGETPLSFHQLFQNGEASETLGNGPVYTLNGDKWEKASLPDVAVNKGEAYWVFADGTATFQGTVELGLEDGGRIMNFYDTINTKTITLINTSDSVKSVELSLENNEVPLSVVGKNELFETIYTPVTDVIKSLTIPASGEALVKVAIRRGEISTAGEKQGILKMIVADTQEVQRLPISAYGVNQ